MKAPYKTLSHFLAELNLTEQQLKRLTGIPIYRLRTIYKDGNFTDDELIKLIKALSARPAVKLVYASQIGNFNQNGIGNTQTFITTIVNIVMRRLAASQPHVLPARPVLIGSVQQQALGQMPGGQVAPINGGFASTGPWALVA